MKLHTGFLRGSSAFFLCELTPVLAGCSLCSAEFECFHDQADKNVAFPFIRNELTGGHEGLSVFNSDLLRPFGSIVRVMIIKPVITVLEVVTICWLR